MIFMDNFHKNLIIMFSVYSQEMLHFNFNEYCMARATEYSPIFQECPLFLNVAFVSECLVNVFLMLP